MRCACEARPSGQAEQTSAATDSVAHVLWAGVGVTELGRHRWIAPRTAAATLVLAALPDVLHLLPIAIWWAFGDDLDTLRGQADALRATLAAIPGVADLEIEKQVLAPQIKVRVDYAAAARYGVPTPQLLATLQSLVEREKLAQVVEGRQRFALVL